MLWYRLIQHKKVVIGALIVLVIIASTAIVVKAKNRTFSVVIESPEPVPQQEVFERDIPSPPPDLELPPADTSVKSLSGAKQVGILVLGYGGAGHQGGFLSDVNLLIHFNNETKKLSFIHIPRDIYVNIPVGSTTIPTKINGALALGTRSGNYPTKDVGSDTVLRGSQLSKLAVQQVTGLSPDFVIGIDFTGFQKAIDSLKGVEVTVATALDDPWYPVKGLELELCGHTPAEVTEMSSTMSGFNLEKQFPCRYEHLQFSPGVHHMDGGTALKFVRSRHSSSDFARGERQIALLNAVKNKLFSLNALDKIPEFYTLLTKSIKTDITIEHVHQFAPVLSQLAGYKFNSVSLNTANVLRSGTSKNGASILIPKSNDTWTETHTYVRNQIQN